MATPDDRLYTKSHEWIRVEDGVGTCGVTDHAQQQLGDVVYVDLPEVGDTVTQGARAGEIESVKAVSDLYAPVSGEVVEINEALDDDPGLVNRDPYGEGWLFRVRLSEPGELDRLMKAAEYDAHAAADAEAH